MSEPTEVGSIVAYLRLDRANWDRELAATRRDLRELGASSPNIRIDTNASQVVGQLALVQAAERKVGQSASQARPDVSSLMQSLFAVAPAAVPIAGAAGLAGAALVSMAIQGTLAIKGVQTEMKNATADGLTFSAGVNTIKADVAELEQTAAKGVLAPFQSAVAKLHGDVPALNADLADSSKVLGDIAGHLVTAGIAGEHSFAPALLSAEQVVDRLAASFETWATGPGGERFGQTLARDFTQVEPVLENVATAVAHLLGAANDTGLGVVAVLDDIATALDAIPTPVLTMLLDGVVALKAVQAVSGMFAEFAVSVRGAAVAEEEAAVASSRLRGGLATGVGLLGKTAAAWIGVSLAANAAARSTQGWASNSNDVQRFVGQLTGAVADLANLNVSKFASDVWGANRKNAEMQAAYVKQLQAELFDQATHLNDVQFQSLQRKGNSLIVGGTGQLSAALQAASAATAGTSKQQTVATQIQAEYGKATAQTTLSLVRMATALTQAATSGESLSQVQGDYQDTAKALQSGIGATEKFLGLGGQTVETYMGMKIGADTYAAALQQTGGDLAKATGLIHAQVDGLATQKKQLAEVSAEQQRLATYASDVGTKYGLTSAQVDLYTRALGINLDQVAKSAGAQQAAEKALGSFVGTLKSGNTAVQGWLAALQQFDQAGDTAASRAQLLGAALVSLNGDALGFQTSVNASAVATQQMREAFDKGGTSLLNLKKGTIDFRSAGAAPLLQALGQMQSAAMNAASAMYQHEVATKGAKRASDDAYQLYESKTRGALVDELTKLTGNAGAAKKLADRYFGMPKDVKTQIRALGADKTDSLLDAIGRQLSYLTGRAWNPKVDVHVSGQAALNNVAGTILALHDKTVTIRTVTQSGGSGYVKARATGGGAPEGWFSVGEQGPELAHKSGSNVQIYSNPDSRQIIAATGMHVQGFASGTGATKSEISSFNSAAHALLVAAAASSSTASQVKSAANALRSAAKAADLSQKALASIAGEQKRLNADARKRDSVRARLGSAPTPETAYDKLAAAQDQFSSDVDKFASAMKAFDITSPGSAATGSYKVGAATVTTSAGGSTAAGIVAADQADVAQAQEFDSLLHQLVAEGMDPNDVAAVAAKGPSAIATARALAKATPAQISQLTALDKQRTATANDLGKYLAQQFDGAGVAAAQGLVNGLKKQEKAITVQMDRIGAEMVKRLRKKLRSNSPSMAFHDIGVDSILGLVGGQRAKLPMVHASSQKVAAAMTGGFGRGSAPGGTAGGGVRDVNVHVHPRAEHSEAQVGKMAASEILWALR